MYDYKKLSALKNAQSKLFEAIQQFITYYNAEIDKGEYLCFVNKTMDTITFKVGAETFTIHSQINLNKKEIKQKVFAWIFDLSQQGQYRHEHVPDLDFYYDGDFKFYTPKKHITKIGSEREFVLIYQFNQHEYYKFLEPFFEQFENSTDLRLEKEEN